MPSVKCGGCSKFLSPIDAAKCLICKALYHRGCADLPRKGYLSPGWSCCECQKRLTKLDKPSKDKDLNSSSDSNSSFRPASDLAHEIPNLVDLLRTFKEDLRIMMKEELQSEFQRLRADMAQLQSDKEQMKDDIKACNERIDTLDSRITAIEQSLKCSTGTNDAVIQLRRELNDRDQQLLANDIEIANLPEIIGENLTHTVALIAAKIGVTLDERDIVSADRVGGNHLNATSAAGATEIRPRPVVVRLTRRNMREELIRNARVRRGANTADLNMSCQPRPFYINERLTKNNRQLFRRARDAGQCHGWQYVWTKNGRILARKKSGEQANIIRTEDDILGIFGPNLQLYSY